MHDIALSENLTARPATLEDAEIVADLFNACYVELTGQRTIEADQLRADWKMPMFNLETDTQIVLGPNGTCAGAANVYDQEPDTQLHVEVHVHPKYKEQGIGTYLEHWITTRAQQAIPKAPDNASVALYQNILENNTVARAFLETRGYQVAHYEFKMLMEMDTPPAPPVLPEGVTIRPFIQGQEEHAMIRAIQEAFKDNWDYVERPFETEYEQWMYWLNEMPDSDPDLWFVAVEGNEIVGTSFCVPQMAEDPELAFIFAVGVRPAWRRRGIALALLRHSFGALYQYGKRKAALVVDAQNSTGATRLYEKAGMHVQWQFIVYEKVLR